MLVDRYSLQTTYKHELNTDYIFVVACSHSYEALASSTIFLPHCQNIFASSDRKDHWQLNSVLIEQHGSMSKSMGNVLSHCH